MKIDILTIFPEMFENVLNTSIIGRAVSNGILEIKVHNIRDYSLNKHHNTDDYPFGGGAGMLMMAQPIFDCIEQVLGDSHAHKLLMSPRGRVLTTGIAKQLAKEDHLLLLAGHYEGVDERVMELMDDELSIGDYVLTGGELPAMVLIDCVARFIPNILGSADSAEDESFTDPGLLEYPQYTRPASFRGRDVPQVLLNGNHAEIAWWRRQQAIIKTFNVRPELLDKAALDGRDKKFLAELREKEESGDINNI